MIFDSLGSNFTFRSAISFLFARGSYKDSTKLKRILQEKYGGEVQLYYRGRSSLAVALQRAESKTVAINGYTCFAVEQALHESGCAPVFVDIAKNGFHFEDQELKASYKKQPFDTVIVQNTYGIPIDIRPIEKFCKTHDITIIEDLAHSVGATYPDGRAVGTVGAYTMLSFGRDKHIDVVNGGALVDRTGAVFTESLHTAPLSQRLRDRIYPLLAWKIRQGYKLRIGAVMARFFTAIGLLKKASGGGVFKDTSLPHYRAARVLHALKHLDADKERRLSLAQALSHTVVGSNANPIRLPVQVENPAEILKRCKQAGMYLFDIWYSSPIYPERYMNQSQYQLGTCPNAEQLAGQMFNIPLHIQVTPKDIQRIISIIDGYQRSIYAHEININNHPEANFLVSEAYVEAQRLSGAPVIKMKTESYQFLAVLRDARRGKYLELAGNPLLNWNDETAVAAVTKELQRVAREHDCAFVRIRPQAIDSPNVRALLTQYGYRRAPMHLLAEDTLILDLNKTEEELLQNMRKNTRYEIRKSHKAGISVRIDNSNESLETFVQLMQQTAQRQHYVLGRVANLKNEFHALNKYDMVRLYSTHDTNNRLLSMAIIVYFNGEADYLYGASTALGLQHSGAYALQWQAIVDAKSNGIERYNFWGVAPEGASRSHRFAGVTTFKRGFGGVPVKYVPAHDLIIKANRYRITKLIELIRKKKRGL